ncbi:TetR/AcrR family transcriptional regulator C-terminal domain-containing protein [Streptomyces sp. CBMA156]|uniref:TetR/AcrR family transcriptional regulator C-terminal domain-containing protein n=1 Tax=Streptomyces sp. CBMA156 TaxID=1930280 RepID=UPI001661EA60|nr:TetR/AcrR family transcriptional regulator C-terminal domain-containing protein [Streptomyces sp. CBMA156]MBD0673180.1 TetR family transcriptional regulator [Streptomyces sp. CBMA156]
MTVYAGQGDARRSLALLWGAPEEPRTGRSGPRPGLSVDAIVSAAVAVADAEGMAALSMRAVGERLGRTAMALYTYVPGKAELLDLMHDRALAELRTGQPPAAGWREAVTAWAEGLYACYLRHPWVLQVSQARPVLGPAELAAMEALLGALRPAALAPPRLRGAVAALWQFVRGLAATTADARGAAAATGVTDEEWWSARSARLAELAPDFAERFPLLVALQSEGGGAPEDTHREAFRTGLAVLLDGIEAGAGPRA